MSILSFLLGEKKKSASVAKERLQLIIAHERAGGEPPADYLPALQRDLVAVISKYVKVSDNDIRVNLERQENLEVLEVKIEIPPHASLRLHQPPSLPAEPPPVEHPPAGHKPHGNEDRLKLRRKR